MLYPHLPLPGLYGGMKLQLSELANNIKQKKPRIYMQGLYKILK